jgi:rare lipoprotein A (peptidoglycan hydrolase)
MRFVLNTVLLFLLALCGLWAQSPMPEAGLAIRLDNQDDRLYATHSQHPFGSRLKVINLLNNTELELIVEGKNENTQALIEISSLASDFLDISDGVLTQVRIEVMSIPTTAPAMRPRAGQVTQIGNALVSGSGNELTASHPSIPFGREVNLTNISNGRTVTVKITGRFPAAVDRIIEISPAAGRALGIQNSGQVNLETE